MKVFTQDKVGRIFILRLDQGDFVLESINELIERENIKNGVVVSAIGTLDYCTLHMVMTTGYPPVEHFEKWEDKPLELASIDGIIADGVPHLHTVVSDHEKAYAGHLEPGCRVLYLAEIVIMELEGDALTRIKNEKGINELHAK
ncbi:MAG: PPC domain-containing DNA-binding protein [Caldicoprobacterales bacterium]|jgi:predicted DNA-binding protein with PD1-like motif